MSDSVTIIDGIATAFSQTGKGSDVLLLHGWGDSRRTYAALAEKLSKNYKVTALDLPGFGATELPKTAWNLTDYANFLKSFCEKLSIKPKLVIGHSNGGALAIHAISGGFIESQKLVLLASSGVRNTRLLRRFGLKIVAKSGKTLLFWLPIGTKRKLQKKLYGVAGSDMLVVPHMKETFKKTVRQDIQSDARSLAIPTLLIYGSEDTATPAREIGQKLHSNIKNSKYAQIDRAGHFVHQDAPDDVNQLIEEFIA